MIGALGIFAVALGAGFLAATVLPWSLGPGRRLLWVGPLGLEAVAVATLGFSWALGTVDRGWAATTGLVVVGLGIFALSPGGRRTIARVWSPRARWGLREVFPLAILLVPWVVFALAVYPHLLVDQGGGLTAGWPTVWADWSAHLRTATFLADQRTFGLENSLLSGVPARYPLAEDFLTSLFLRSGLELTQAFLWSGLPFFLLLPALVQAFLRRAGLSAWMATLGTLLFLASGGFGFFGAVWNPDPFRPGLADGWFQNFVTSEFLPQRAFLFGLPGALALLGTFDERFVRTPTRRHRWPEALGLGLGWSALLLVHTHSALALALIFVVGAGAGLVRELRAGVRVSWVPATVLAAAALGAGGLVFAVFLMDPGKTGTLVHLIGGWVPGPTDPVSGTVFLVGNLGVILLASLGALAVPAPRTRRFAWSAFALLVTANLVAFQPWTWDNEKLLTWWYLLAVAASLSAWSGLFRIPGRPRRIVLGVVLAAASMAASASGLWNLATVCSVTAQPRIPLVSAEGMAFARAAAGRPGVVALSPDHDHPLSLLSGLRIYLGYTGWVWSYGLPYQDRLEVLNRIYSGGPTGLAAAQGAGISWVALGPPERARFHTDAAILEATFPVTVRVGAWELLEVPGARP